MGRREGSECVVAYFEGKGGEEEGEEEGREEEGSETSFQHLQVRGEAQRLPLVTSRRTTKVFPIDQVEVKQQLSLQISQLKQNLLSLRSSLVTSNDSAHSVELAKKAHLISLVLFPS